MNIKTLFAVACSAAALLGTGCVGTNDGHSKFGLWTKDTMPSRYERSVAQVVAATRVVLNRDGRLLMDNSVDNTFKAMVNEKTVFVKVTKVDDKITQVEVQARGGVNGDIYLAAQIDKEIGIQLALQP